MLVICKFELGILFTTFSLAHGSTQKALVTWFTCTQVNHLGVYKRFVCPKQTFSLMPSE